MARSDIRFWFRGAVQSVTGISPQMTVLRWLREHVKATGTKEGCAEGDCGACTVAIATLDAGAPGGLRLMAVNSCIQFLPTLDGKALFTVEDLETLAGIRKLHPVQQAMVDCHGSQCGFCTPGFVMSLWTDYDNRAAADKTSEGGAGSGKAVPDSRLSGSQAVRRAAVPPTRDETLATVSGNLCRCTGYRPIIDAAVQAWNHPRVLLNRKPVCKALLEIAALPALSYSFEGQSFDAPRTVAELADLYERSPDARLVAGSTDAGLWVTKQMKTLGDIIYTGEVEELGRIMMEIIDDESDRGRGDSFIGAAVNLNDAYTMLSASDPAWKELGLRFASMPVRNAGTLGGNIANGSPIGDSMPPLIALGASVKLQKGSAVREILLEDFYLDYQKTALQPGEFVRAVRVPGYTPAFSDTASRTKDRTTLRDLLSGETFFRVWKISKRVDQDISAVCGAFAVAFGDRAAGSEGEPGDRAANKSGSGLPELSVRVAFGGMAAIPKRTFATEKILYEYFAETGPAAASVAAGASEARLQSLFARTEAAIQTDFRPLTDMRATSAYRLKVAQNLVRRFVREFETRRQTPGRAERSGAADSTGPRGDRAEAAAQDGELLSLAELRI